jgi:hypothetical protein
MEKCLYFYRYNVFIMINILLQKMFSMVDTFMQKMFI